MESIERTNPTLRGSIIASSDAGIVLRSAELTIEIPHTSIAGVNEAVGEIELSPDAQVLVRTPVLPQRGLVASDVFRTVSSRVLSEASNCNCNCNCGGGSSNCNCNCNCGGRRVFELSARSAFHIRNRALE